VQRSGIRWLKENGHYCHPGELIAHCNIGLALGNGGSNTAPPFKDEMQELQVGFATKIGGRLFQSESSSLGGYLDHLYHYQEWVPQSVIGEIEPEKEDSVGPALEQGALSLFMFAGRRFVPLGEFKSDLMAGWHKRSRAWFAESPAPCGTLLSLGICEQFGVIRGHQRAFIEFLESTPGPVHVVYIPDNPLIPTACLVSQQMARSAAQFEEIAFDIARTWHQVGTAATPDDWLFMGVLLACLEQKPLGDGYDMLSRSGLSRSEAPDAVLLSINSETSTILRHKRLGYWLNCHEWRIAEAGPATRAWLRTAFEPVKRTPEMIRRDLRELIRSVTTTEFLIMNAMSTSGYEDVFTYSPFERPMGERLKTHHSKEINLMLHDLARECEVAIVDTDAIAADLGAEAHMPDGLHQSGALESETRQEIIRLLAARGVPGFGPTKTQVI
jgi:hypothetical protein